MRKRIFTLLAAMTMTASLLVGCGNSHSSAPEADTSITVQKDSPYAQKRVGISISNFSDSFATSYRNELYVYLMNLGFSEENVIVADSAGDAALQKNQVHNFVVDKYDAIIVDPVDPAAVSLMTDLAVEAEIPLVYVNHTPIQEEQDRWVQNQWKVSYVGSDYAYGGKIQGKILTKLGMKAIDFNKDETVNYIMVTADQANPEMKARTESSIKYMKKKGLKVKKTATIKAEGDATLAQQKVTEALAKKENIVDVIICNDDTMAIGAMKAIEVSNRTVGKDILLVGADGTVEGLNAVLEGNMTGTVYHDYITQSHMTGDVTLRFLNGEANEYKNICPYVLVTQENAQAILDQMK